LQNSPRHAFGERAWRKRVGAGNPAANIKAATIAGSNLTIRTSPIRRG
jgi:hypothetical protein